MYKLKAFVEESNRIEGIHETTDLHVKAHERFLEIDKLSTKHVESLVDSLQPHARLRDKPGMNVYVGLHTPPPGGANIYFALEGILGRVNIPQERDSVYKVHCAYETLHPFSDGNGRSGRAIWAWMQLKYNKPFGIDLGFLHAWYYQSLDDLRSSEMKR